MHVDDAELRRYGRVADHDAAHRLDPPILRRRITGFLDGSELAQSENGPAGAVDPVSP
ncbi:MAG: hypothetical protein ACRDP1_15255 [Nocardioidaceae bacterium]